jgi:FtsP/CotA-like multicopper oxidase with cupredoxin domain
VSRLTKALLSILALGIAAVLAFGTWIFLSYQDAKVDTIGKVDFDRRLAIPELAPSTVEPDGTRVFDLEIQRGETDLGKSKPTRTWGINGTFLGPTLRASRGEKIRIEATNDVGEATTLHWHGMHLPARMDGGPHQMIAPGTTWKPHWTIDQPAASLWYHPHLHGKTASHVYKGLAGMFILDDEHESSLALPRAYGVDDLPLIVQDKNFDSDGQLDSGHSLFSNLGTLGDEILVNGTPGPYAEITTEAVRLRLLNGSGGRTFTFTFDDRRQFDVIATDGGLLEAPVPVDRLQLAPGERAEVVVRFTAGETRCCAARSSPATTTASRAATRGSTCCSCGRRRRSSPPRRCRDACPRSTGWIPPRRGPHERSRCRAQRSTARRWTCPASTRRPKSAPRRSGRSPTPTAGPTTRSTSMTSSSRSSTSTATRRHPCSPAGRTRFGCPRARPSA